jgi:hypothetical protein
MTPYNKEVVPIPIVMHLVGDIVHTKRETGHAAKLQKRKRIVL